MENVLKRSVLSKNSDLHTATLADAIIEEVKIHQMLQSRAINADRDTSSFNRTELGSYYSSGNLDRSIFRMLGKPSRLDKGNEDKLVKLTQSYANRFVSSSEDKDASAQSVQRSEENALPANVFRQKRKD